MLQVYLVRHGETQWNARRHTQGQSDSPLTIRDEQQTMQVIIYVKGLGIMHIISNNLERTRRTAETIVQACDYDTISDSRLREPNMGILEAKNIDSPAEEEGNWCRQLVNGTVDGYTPRGEPMQELSNRVSATLESCQNLPWGSQPLLVSHDIALGCLVSTILGLPVWAEHCLCLCNCSISRVDYQENLWLASGWVVETARGISYLDVPALDELQRQ